MTKVEHEMTAGMLASASSDAIGMSIVIGFLFTVFIVICGLDIYCIYKRWPSIGYRLQKWSHWNPFYVAGLLGVLATLLTHFLANAL
jgi:hypothetical protein